MTTNWTSDMYVSGSQDLYPSGMRGSDPVHSVEPAAGSSGGADFSLFDPGVFGDLEDGLFVDFLDSEEGSHLALARLEKLGHAAQGGIPKPQRRQRSQPLEKLTTEDFEEGPERNAFLLVDAHARSLFSDRSTPQMIQDAITFFFTIEDDGINPTFQLCCEALGARVDVLRLRIQYEFWLRASIFTGPFPFLTVPVPSMIAGEIAFYGGDEAVALARECWVQPGFATDDLLDTIEQLDGHSRVRLQSSLSLLEERFLMSCQADRWYVTGRNPMLLMIKAQSRYGLDLAQGGSFHWSRLFGKGA